MDGKSENEVGVDGDGICARPGKSSIEPGLFSHRMKSRLDV